MSATTRCMQPHNIDLVYSVTLSRCLNILVKSTKYMWNRWGFAVHKRHNFLVLSMQLRDICCLRPLWLSHCHLSRLQPVLVRYPQLHRHWHLHREELCFLLGLRCKSTPEILMWSDGASLALSHKGDNTVHPLCSSVAKIKRLHRHTFVHVLMSDFDLLTNICHLLANLRNTIEWHKTSTVL